MDLNQLYGIFTHQPVLGLLASAFLVLAVGYFGSPLIIWSVVILALGFLFAVPLTLLVIVAGILAVFNIKPIRRFAVTHPVMRVIDSLKIMPAISETERIALEAGTTWVEGELFAGKPDFNKILQEPYPSLTKEERDFLNGPVEELCQLASDWEIFLNKDLPQPVWDCIKEKRFMGMIIPKEYGGHGFSALCHSEVIQKLASRSVPLGVTVMVPNSLGPAELLIHYGTQKQKDYYLPRLATGQEIPCFALTEPHAGSDAGKITSHGEVFKGSGGDLKIKLTWEKRYITLAAISTVIGLAIKLRDPANHLGKGEELGITCVLVPSHLPGVALGERHNPMGVPFYNCPTRGENVVVSIDQIIGGADGAGRGWQMLMKSLAAGRAISLPAQSTGTAKLVARATSAYGIIREQFGQPIARFEGVEERLANIFGMTYLLEATRRYTAGAVDSGLKPSVVSAIAKYNTTEISRTIINDGMDVLAGAGISRGPRNLLANSYIATPIGITVEGANILTRTMIIFGQGAIRCHPHAYQELKTLNEKDLVGFDRAFWGHIGFVVRNVCRAIALNVTRGWLVRAPVSGPLAKYYRRLSWCSATFAVLADVAMGTLGGKLKMKEKLTGRYADILSWMYMAAAVLRRFEAEGRQAAHLPYAQYALEQAFANIQEAYEGIFANFDIPVLRHVLSGPVALWFRINRMGRNPSDQLGQRIVRHMVKPTKLREALTDGIFVPSIGENEPLAIYERAFHLAHEAEVAMKKVRVAVRAKRLPKKVATNELVEKAVAEGIISSDEANVIRMAEQSRREAIEVDSFKLDEFNMGLLETRKSG